MPDYFDRLLARYTPVAGADVTDGPGARVRVRPRLSGPFERAEALRHGQPEQDEPAALIPSAPRAVPEVRPVRPDREPRTERHTVVRTEQAPRPGEPEQPVPPRSATPASPLPRPAATASPAGRPGAAQDARAARRGQPSAPDDPMPGSATAAAPAPASAAPARAAALPVPRDIGSAGVRGAAIGSVGRRAPRPAERVVHVRIGRLEVSAAPPPGTNASPAGRPERPAGRPAPVLTLDDYLSRGGKRD